MNGLIATCSATDLRLCNLERTVRRLRACVAWLVLGIMVLGLAAWRGQGALRGESLILADPEGNEILVLRGVRGIRSPMLRLEDPSGAEVLTLGSDVRKLR